MENQLLNFIQENNLSPFNKFKTPIKNNNQSIYSTRDAKIIHNKVIQKISANFVFSDTSNLFNIFDFSNNLSEIKQRQEFFKKIQLSGKKQNEFLKKLTKPKEEWSPKYDILVVTEDGDIFNELKKRNCPCQLLISENDLTPLKEIDLVQVLECNEFGSALESLSQAVFLNSIEEAYLERYLEILSAWKNNITILNSIETNDKIKEILNQLSSHLELIQDKKTGVLSIEEIENLVEQINERVNQEIRKLTISGDSIVALLHKKSMPEELKSVLEFAVVESGLPRRILNIEIPVSIDMEELEKFLKEQNSSEFSIASEKIKNNANKLIQIPNNLQELSNNLILYDFISGISQFVSDEMQFPCFSEELYLKNSKNIFLEKPQPVSFYLNEETKCSILTGANSGGKTTLIEHIIQLISLSYLGLPVYGEVKIPFFTDVYYFAKNKGSLNKGAFETLLTQMSGIKPGNKTFILADEIESVTEPGVAGNIIASTADYYIRQNCFLLIATHLGYEIQKILPYKTRIDGIEAKGLDQNFELIVDHNPVLGKLANSTPELIVEKMANNEKTPYFIFLNEFLKNKK